jgi:hypothetical protein
MARIKIRHLVERSREGRTPRFYWQPSGELRAAGWQPERLPDDWAAAMARAEQLNADVDAWRRGEAPIGAPAAAVKRQKRAAPGTVSALIVDYRGSRWWAKLAPRTRRDYEWCLEAIEAWAGDQPARAVTPPAVIAFHDAQARRVEGTGRARRVIETPAKAAAAVRLGYVTSNAAARPGIGLTRQREPQIWSPAEVRHVAAAADALGWRSMGTAILLNEWIGQRVEDVLRLPAWTAEGGALAFRQGKTGRHVRLPLALVPHLVERLRAEAARPGQVVSTSHLVVHDRTGQPWKLFTWSHVFAEVRAAAAEGIKDKLEPMPSCARLLFRELRHTAVTRLHEAGVDHLGIAGVTGHTEQTVRAMCQRHYLVRTERAAERAFRARLTAEGEG